ncbi:MAG: hypothetical protein HY841_11740 [Bacteroidetes bacterium]|nr:hypothetical protein [Bacteroidota bacterium]
MDIIYLEWEKTNIKELSEFKDTFFYAFTKSNTLLYIGIAWYQPVDKEVKNTIRKLDYPADKLVIWLGYIKDCSLGRITENIIRDTESLMVCINNPRDNTHYKKNYIGRDYLKVVSYDCSFLHDVIYYDHPEFFPVS